MEHIKSMLLTNSPSSGLNPKTKYRTDKSRTNEASCTYNVRLPSSVIRLLSFVMYVMIGSVLSVLMYIWCFGHLYRARYLSSPTPQYLTQVTPMSSRLTTNHVVCGIIMAWNLGTLLSRLLSSYTHNLHSQNNKCYTCLSVLSSRVHLPLEQKGKLRPEFHSREIDNVSSPCLTSRASESCVKYVCSRVPGASPIMHHAS